jgi:hypothetical protein
MPDPARAAITDAVALLARVRVLAAEAGTDRAQRGPDPERDVYLGMLAILERGLARTMGELLDGLAQATGRAEAEGWLRRQLGGLDKEGPR